MYNGILLSHENGHIWVTSDEMDEPRAYCKKWSKPEREEQILSINAYIRILERWYWRTYLQGSNADADIENRLPDMLGEGEWDE